METLIRFFSHKIAMRDVNMWIAGIAYAIAVYLILVILQPFGINTLGDSRFALMIPFGIVTFFGCVAPYFIMPLIRKDFFQADKWTRGRYLALLACNVVLISIGIFILFITMSRMAFSLYAAWTALWQTVVITLLVFGLNMLLPERKHKEEKRGKKGNLSVKLTGSGKNETVDIDISSLLYIESARNYCNIVTKQGTTQIRSTMTSIEEQLTSFSHMKKCHRAYIVNVDNILTTDGNSTTGYKLIMVGGIEEVPVARSYVKEIIS